MEDILNKRVGLGAGIGGLVGFLFFNVPGAIAGAAAGRMVEFHCSMRVNVISRPEALGTAGMLPLPGR